MTTVRSAPWTDSGRRRGRRWCTRVTTPRLNLCQRSQRPGQTRTGDSARSRQRQEQLLHLLDVQVVGAALGDALLKTRGHDGEAGAVQRLGDSGKLGDDVLAVAALFEHAYDAGQLALGALDPVDDWLHRVGV